MKRIFIAINFPAEIKSGLIQISKSLDNFCYLLKDYADIRLIPVQNWHITVAFLGYQPESQLLKIKEAIESAIKEIKPLEIKLEKFLLAPPDKNIPKMLWMSESKDSSIFVNSIKQALKGEFFKMGINYKDDYRRFNCHVTVARFKSVYRQNYFPIKESLANLPPISINFKPATLDLMESRLKKSGAEYDILYKVDFKK